MPDLDGLQTPKHFQSAPYVRLKAFIRCGISSESVLPPDLKSAGEGADLAMMVMECSSIVCDKAIHGVVAFIAGLGFEMLSGSICSADDRVTFQAVSFRFDEDVPTVRFSDIQLFTAFFRRPAPKANIVSHRPVPDLAPEIAAQLSKLVLSKSADSQTSLCSEDLAGIKELTVVDHQQDFSLRYASDWPQSYREALMNKRVLSQPLQGFGHRPPGQLIFPKRYKLRVVGVNQAGFLTFVHNMLMISGFRIISADIETVRGSYASNTYLVETFSVAGERLLRANFQCIVPLARSSVVASALPLFQNPQTSPHINPEISQPVACWSEDGSSAYCGTLLDGKRNGFGRLWRSRTAQSLANYSFEGDWENDSENGFGFRLVDDGSCVAYSFGLFDNGELVDGTVLYPFEPPAKSLRIDPTLRPDQCVYRALIQRSEHWRRQLPRNERPIAYLPVGKVRGEHAALLRSSWTMFAESPVPATASMNACQVAGLLEMCGLTRSAKAAFAKRIDGGLLEAMTDSHLRDILGLQSESQRNMVAMFVSFLSKAHNIDRHMRQPASVLDALVNPAISGRFLPLGKMRVVDTLGEGAYGKVIYAEYKSTEDFLKLEKSISQQIVNSAPDTKTNTPRASGSPGAVSPASSGRANSLISALTRRSFAAFSPSKAPSVGASAPSHLYVALKEQVGSGAQLENSCELVREWATLNALAHENIVRLEGICADESAPMFNKRYLATALIEASLPSLIYSKDPYGQAPPLTPLLTIQLAGDIASGLAHMHSLDLMHGDIKSPNVLVDIRTRDRPIARLCDFGHAAIRVGPRPQRRMCTFGWASPESLRDADTDKAADVWSWATVCWEMYVKEVPWKGCSHPQMLVAVGYCGLDPSGFKNQGIPQRVKAERKMAKLCAKCWDVDPLKRPTMDRVLNVVDKLSRTSAQQAVIQLESLLQ